MSNVVTAIFRPEQQVAEMLRELADMADRGELQSAVVLGEMREQWVFRTVLDPQTEGAAVLGVVHVLAFQMAQQLASD